MSKKNAKHKEFTPCGCFEYKGKFSERKCSSYCDCGCHQFVGNNICQNPETSLKKQILKTTNECQVSSSENPLSDDLIEKNVLKQLNELDLLYDAIDTGIAKQAIMRTIKETKNQFNDKIEERIAELEEATQDYENPFECCIEELKKLKGMIK